LSKARYDGRILVRLTVNKEGRIDKEKIVLLECPHFLFARNSLDTILNDWVFRPATMDGNPVEIVTDIEVTFRVRY
jgi:outer membrane biosynthesis protein TonB